MPILANLERASSTLRAFIDAEALEELIGKTVKRRAGSAIKPGKTSASFANKYRGPIDLRVPAPKDGRPRNAAGATSFHFDQEVVKKTKVKSATGSAATTNPASAFEGYASNPSKVAQVSVEIAERYLAAPKGSGIRDETVSRIAMMASNIGNTIEEREDFWTAAWAASNTPGVPVLELRPVAGSIAEWRSLAADAKVPNFIADEAGQVVRERLAIGSGPAKASVIRVPLLDPEAIAWADAIDTSDRDREDRIAHYVKPRSGVVMLKLVAEIPHELHSEDRCAIISALAADLDAVGVRYTIVAHAPDDNNDRRNEHLHILIFPGSCVRNADDSWDFKGGRRLRPGSIAARLGFNTDALPAGAFFDLAFLDIAALRRRYAEHCNDRLEHRGVPRRLDARSYAEMGIAQEAQKHLGTNKAAMVAAGAHVKDDRENMIKSWKPQFERLDSADRSERQRQEDFLDRIDAVGAGGATDQADQLARLTAEYRAVSAAACELSWHLARLDLEKELAWSGAERLSKKTLSLLKAISAGTASAADIRNAPHIEARQRLANDHLYEIHTALKPWSGDIEAARVKLDSDRDRLGELEHQIEAVVLERDQKVRIQIDTPGWADTTILDASLYPTPLAPHAHVAALIGQMQDQAKAVGPVDPDRMIFAVREPVIPPRISAHGLGPADTALLSRDPYRRRFEAALDDVCKHQEFAIGRALNFIAKNGEEALAMTGGHERDKTHRSLMRWYRAYRDHPVLHAGLDAARHEYQMGLEQARGLVGLDIIEDAQPVPPVAVSPSVRRNPAEIAATEPINERASADEQKGTPETASLEARLGVFAVRDTPVPDVTGSDEPALPLNPTTVLEGAPAAPVEAMDEESAPRYPVPGVDQVATEVADHPQNGLTVSTGPSVTVTITPEAKSPSSKSQIGTSSMPSPTTGSNKLATLSQLDRLRMLREEMAGRRGDGDDEVNRPQAEAAQAVGRPPAEQPEAAREGRSAPAQDNNHASWVPAPVDPIVQVRENARADIRYRRMSGSQRQSFEEYMDEITIYLRKDSIRLFVSDDHIVSDRQTAILSIVNGAVASELGFDTVRAIAATFEWPLPTSPLFDHAIARPGAAAEMSGDDLRLGWDAYRNKRGKTARD